MSLVYDYKVIFAAFPEGQGLKQSSFASDDYAWKIALDHFYVADDLLFPTAQV